MSSIATDLYAWELPALHLADVDQVLEQAAVAAAEVEYFFARLDPLGDDFIVITVGSHAYTLMRSNQAESTAWYWGSSSRKESWPAAQSISA